jgi:AcrR family transcriptional regulator
MGAAPTADLEPRDTAPSQRDRILDAALRLMSEHGAGSTSMRQLARACDMNVAGLYHYFPSKAELFRSVIAERQYQMRLRHLPPLADGVDDLSPGQRLEALMVEIWVGAMGEEPVWRLLLGESLRSDETAIAVCAELLVTIEEATRQWLAALFPDLGSRSEATVALVMGQLYTAFLERMFRPDVDVEVVRTRARALARLVFGDDG